VGTSRWAGHANNSTALLCHYFCEHQQMGKLQASTSTGRVCHLGWGGGGGGQSTTVLLLCGRAYNSPTSH
jgi:hypothetical protein